MTRPSKREIEREVKNLQPSDPDDGVGCVFDLAHVDGAADGTEPADWSASPHPMLSYKPFPERKPYSLKVAVPHFIPEPWASKRFLFVVTCANADRHGVDRSRSNTATACELWEPLTEDELRAEKRVRQENDEPIPALLEKYDVTE